MMRCTTAPGEKSVSAGGGNACCNWAKAAVAQRYPNGSSASNSAEGPSTVTKMSSGRGAVHAVEYGSTRGVGGANESRVCPLPEGGDTTDSMPVRCDSPGETEVGAAKVEP